MDAPSPKHGLCSAKVCFGSNARCRPRLCEKSRAIVKLDIFSKTLRTFVVLSGIALTGPKCGTLCARTIARIASNLTR